MQLWLKLFPRSKVFHMRESGRGKAFVLNKTAFAEKLITFKVFRFIFPFYHKLYFNDFVLKNLLFISGKECLEESFALKEDMVSWRQEIWFVIEITFYSPTCLGQKTVKGHFLVFKSSYHLPTCLSPAMNEAVNINFYSLWFDLTGNRAGVYRFSSCGSKYQRYL